MLQYLFRKTVIFLSVSIPVFFPVCNDEYHADDESAGLGKRERPPYPVDTAEKDRQKQHCGNLENAGS